MSSSEAQRSPVHESTEDSSREPTGPAAPASMTPGRSPERDAAAQNDPDESSFGGPLKIDDPDAADVSPDARRGEGRTEDK